MNFGPPSKKRRGGLHQRLAAADRELEMKSSLYSLLMLHYAKGLMSGGELVHSIAVAAQKDLDNQKEGYKIIDLQKITHLKHGKNLGPSLTRMMAREADLPDPFEVDIPMQASSPHCPSASILLPHEFFAAMYQKGNAFVKCILPDASKLEGFWRVFENHPTMVGHPIKLVPGWREKTIPLGLHGDEVPVQGVGKIWSRCALVFTWFSLMANLAGVGFQDEIWRDHGCVLASPGLVFWGTCQRTVARKRLERQWISCWLQRCQKGQPAFGWWVESIAVANGDYFAKWLETPRATSHQPCILRRCKFQGHLSWLDGALFSVPGFNNQCLAMGWMHCHHLGWIQHFFGSVLHLLLFYLLPQEHLENLWQVGEYIKTHQKQSKHRYRMRLDKLTMFQPKNGFPKMRGRAADIASLAKPLLDLWTEKMNPGDGQHIRVKLFLKLYWELKELLETFSPTYGHMAIPEAQYKKVFGAGLTMAQLRNQLSEHFDAEDIKIFNVTSKMHFALHSLQYSKFIHPFLVWCYKGESTMHRAQTLWKSCLAGSKHWQASKKACWKERHLMWLQGKVWGPVAWKFHTVTKKSVGKHAILCVICRKYKAFTWGFPIQTYLRVRKGFAIKKHCSLIAVCLQFDCSLLFLM